MAAVLGRNFRLSVYDGTSAYNNLAGQTSGTLSVSGDSVDVTTDDDAGWTTLLQSRQTFSFSAEGELVDEADTALVDLRAALVTDKATISCKFTSPGGETFTGDCIVESIEYKGGESDAMTYSVSLKGAGALTIA